jgi:hypothetical protein
MMIPEKKESFDGLQQSFRKENSTADEAQVLLDFWKDEAMPTPQVDTTLPKLEDLRQPDEASIDEQLKRDYLRDFGVEANSVSLTVSKIPEDVLRAKKKELDDRILKNKVADAEDMVRKQADLLWKEDDARGRLLKLQKESLDKVRAERELSFKEMQEREAALGREFRRAREALEYQLKQQQSSLREKFGDLKLGEQSISRAYKLQWDLSPQPIEMRMHIMRAVKNKLPKGSYMLMLTQYDTLGGRPLSWSVAGTYGIGKDRPATTKPFRHYGRFFDRVLKVEGSAFALCPPSALLKPGNVFIIELFRLASRRNPVNSVVGWAALPMCTPYFSVVEGKFKLPILRGEHSPAVQHYKAIEETIGNDLNSWLCNIYVEVKHLPKTALTDSGAAVDEYDIEFDFMKKLLNVSGQAAPGVGFIDVEMGGGGIDGSRKLGSSANEFRSNDSARSQSRLARNTAASEPSGGTGQYTIELAGGSGKSRQSELDPLSKSLDSLSLSKSTSPRVKATQPPPPQAARAPAAKLDEDYTIEVAGHVFGDSGRAARHRGYPLRAAPGVSGSYDQEDAAAAGDAGDAEDSDPQKKGLVVGRTVWSSLRGMFVSKSSQPESASSRFSRTMSERRPGTLLPAHGELTTDEEEEGGADDEDMEVLERGYDPEDEFFLDSQQLGKLAGLETIGDEDERQWAASGIDRNFVRR